ncbi:response regulator transcription factor [Neobacillus sp. LXY-1]|uniref:response regulator transcription factor n=1 Tax=Neobacillus sp. LXY-1 TaxID=3379133 RepID=UPI003EE19AEE
MILNISIIDDDSFIRSTLKRIIELINLDPWEIYITEFENGFQFFDLKQLDKPGKHFVIVDGTMPMMDGIEVLKKIKNIKEDTTIMMLSERKSEGNIEKAMKLGASEYITKPFSIKGIKATIEQIVQRIEK